MRVRRPFFARIRGYFLTGLVVTVPLGATAYLTWWAVRLLDEFMLKLVPARYGVSGEGVLSLPGMGIVATVVIMIVVGWIAATVSGRFFVGLGERIIDRMPVIRSIYGGMKQVFETVFARQSIAFRQAVLVKFPNDDTWAIAFLTQRPSRAIRDVAGQDVYAVFMPTAPNPTSGYLLFFPKEKVRQLNLSVEEAFKLILSGGLVSPDILDDGQASRR